MVLFVEGSFRVAMLIMLPMASFFQLCFATLEYFNCVEKSSFSFMLVPFRLASCFLLSIVSTSPFFINFYFIILRTSLVSTNRKT